MGAVIASNTTIEMEPLFSYHSPPACNRDGDMIVYGVSLIQQPVDLSPCDVPYPLNKAIIWWEQFHRS